MTDWKNIKIEGIVEIRKCVAEFSVSELKYTPWLNFKVNYFMEMLKERSILGAEDFEVAAPYDF